MKQHHRAAAVGGLAAAVALAAVAITASVPRPGAPTLAPYGKLPSRGRLLWLDGRPTVPGYGAVAARDSTGRVLLVDDRLRVREAVLPGDIGSVASAAPAARAGVWVVDAHGRLRELTEDGATATEIAPPFAVSALGGVGRDGRLAVVRSPEGFPFLFDTLPVPPVALVDTADRLPPAYVGQPTRVAQPLLADLANAGYVQRLGEVTLYAPFVRDEVVALAPNGDTVWVLRRGLGQETPEPRFRLRSGRPVLDYFPVNLGLGIGPDGRIYVLSTADMSLAHARLDVLEPITGQTLATFSLPTIFPTLVVTRRGSIHLVASHELLDRAREAARPSVPPFSWPGPDGSRVTQSALIGRVTVINVWASWCEPCREEMPALVSLWQALSDSGLAFLAVNEDVRMEAARRWLHHQGPEPPVAFARGAARRTLGYRGLPYTILVDREGRIVRKWVGYRGEMQIADVEAAARRELQLAAAPGAASHRSAHRHEAPR